jgi:hypothetical protein
MLEQIVSGLRQQFGTDAGGHVPEQRLVSQGLQMLMGRLGGT